MPIRTRLMVIGAGIGASMGAMGLGLTAGLGLDRLIVGLAGLAAASMAGALTARLGSEATGRRIATRIAALGDPNNPSDPDIGPAPLDWPELDAPIDALEQALADARRLRDESQHVERLALRLPAGQ